MDTISFNFHHEEGTIIILKLKIRNGDSKRSYNMPKVIWLESNRYEP